MTYIYRYMSFLQFLDLIESKRLYFSAVEKWDDKYEAFAAKLYYAPPELLNGLPEIFRLGLQEANLKTLYAQSWTLADESDALWRIYSDGTGVRIRTTIEQVESFALSAIQRGFNSNYDVKDFSHFAVNYVSTLQYADTDFRLGSVYSVTPEKALKDKRDAFKHEEEYRFCVRIKKKVQASSTSDPERMYEILRAGVPGLHSIYYDFELGGNADVKLDPRAPKYVEESFLAYCKNREFDKSGITYQKSKLYTL